MLRKVICAVGLVVCGYLLYLTEYVGICLDHCDPFNYSLGLAWFLIGLILKERGLQIWALAGLLGIAYFVIRELFEGFCLYCTFIHLIALTAVLSTKTDRALSRYHRKVR
ncbi:hypothetical protein Arcpr_0034 [Archaeoglobus profundus DSM 5631]|uniref:Vitamin K epoxide reductase n=1 Tax=Archaeoglobus profundus (strain DSM 5631 / JCM 9629 / NBRC 100127 / Av18) TaxID=572546 RepID=D2RFN6_ARCPA|nr:hypothetical protein Arcpr_0034 [Archaeoglobus profundus DSM 5631]